MLLFSSRRMCRGPCNGGRTVRRRGGGGGRSSTVTKSVTRRGPNQRGGILATLMEVCVWGGLREERGVCGDHRKEEAGVEAREGVGVGVGGMLGFSVDFALTGSLFTLAPSEGFVMGGRFSLSRSHSSFSLSLSRSLARSSLFSRPLSLSLLSPSLSRFLALSHTLSSLSRSRSLSHYLSLQPPNPLFCT